jgi:sigma-B regulation protein RsbU (phosphoserine phosphatase)
MRILIAEDSSTARTILTAMLEKCGHEVLATCDGLQAWGALRRPDAPRLAILDWMMPGMDGPDVCRRARSLRTERPCYLMLLTTRSDKADLVAGLEAGANDYVTKPPDLGELRARIEVGRRLVEAQDQLADKVEQLRSALDHVKTLRGILPICAHCKKIRDDAGYWSQVETYVRNHSEAEFSHGICPSCVAKLYAELMTDAAAKPGG